MKTKGLNVSQDNLFVARQADVVIIAVKPYYAQQVLQEIKPELNSSKILISIVAGVKIKELEKFAGNELPISGQYPTLPFPFRNR